MANANNATSTRNSDQDNATAIEVGEELSYVASLFDDVDDAKRAYKSLREVAREGFVDILDAAYVEKTERGRIKVHDHADWAIGGGIIGGGVTGAIIGLIAGTVLLPAAIGALVGGVILGIHEHDTNFKDKDLRELGDDMPPGTSVLIAIVEDPYIIAVEEEVRKLGGKNTHSGRVPKSTVDSLKT